MEGKLIKTGDQFLLRNKENEVIAITSGTMEGRMLSLKNCQAIENDYDLEELAEKHYDVHIKQGHAKEDSLQRKIDFILGFQKALEILGDKKFSEEDVISMIEKSRETGLTAEYLVLTKQQTEWDVEIEMEQYVKYVPKSLATVYPTGGVRPKLDNNGCLILKRK